MRISDWSSDVCSSDLLAGVGRVQRRLHPRRVRQAQLPRKDHRQGTPGRPHPARELPQGGEGGGKDRLRQIGRASCRERVCQYVEISVVAGSFKKKKTKIKTINKYDQLE